MSRSIVSLSSWLAIAALAVLPSSTLAQSLSPLEKQPTGWYGSVSPGAAFGYSLDIESEAFEVAVPAVVPGITLPAVQVDPIDISIDADTGFAVSGALGYQFKAGRAELELGYNRNSVNSVNVTGLPEVDADGRFDVWSLSANGYYDIPTGTALRPYIGGGVGIAKLAADDVEVAVPLLGTATLDDSGVSAIFQAKAGLAYDFSKNTSAFLGYRLQALPGQDFTIENVDFDAETLLIHSLQVGAMVRF